VKPDNIIQLSYCVHMLPKAHDSKDESAEEKVIMGKEVRYR